MADPYEREIAPWLEKELSRQLAPVCAPDGLWDRMNRPRRNPRPRAVLDWAFWPAVALTVLLALGGIVRGFGGAEQSLLAVAGRSGGPAYRSGNFDDIRTWVKQEADIDIDLPAGQSAANRPVQLLGARLLRFRGVPVAAIEYRIGAEAATLFVSGKHAGAKLAPERGLYSWNVRDETYLVSSSESSASRKACLLCHPASFRE